jgi:hypothetical protein
MASPLVEFVSIRPQNLVAHLLYPGRAWAVLILCISSRFAMMPAFVVNA